MQLLWRSQYRFLLRHPLLTVLTVLGVALGVAVIHATDIANRSARASIAESQQRLHGFAQYRLLGSGAPIAETDYADLRRRWLSAHPHWRLLPVLSGSVEWRGQQWQLLGVDPLADLRLGGAGANATNAADLIAAPAALLSADSAAALGIRPGATLRIDTGGGAHTLKVVGSVADPRHLLARLLITDIGTAQQLLGLSGRLSYLELATGAPLTAAAQQQLRATLPAGLQLLASDDLLSGQTALLDAFQFNLSALSVLALLVGCLLMFSAAQFGFWQRRPLLQRFHLLGAPARGLLLCLLLESLLLSALACIVGWALGALLSRALLPLAAGTVNDLFAAQTIVRFGGTPAQYAKTALLATTATLGANLLLFARWRNAADTMPRRRYWALAIAAAALGGAALFAPGATLAAGFFAIFALAGAWLLAAPELYRGALQLLSKLRLGPLLTLALRDSRRHYRRLGLALAALCLALAAGLGIRVMVESFRLSLSGWLEQQVAADLYVRAAPAQMPALLAALRERPEAAALSQSRSTTLTVRAAPLTLQALDLPVQVRRHFPLLAATAASWQQWQQQDAVIAGEPLARKWHLAVGDTLTLPTPAGPRPFRIAAISRDYGTGYGRLVVSLATYRRHWPDTAIDSIAVYLRPGADPAPLQRQLQRAGYQVSAGRAIKQEVTRVFDRTFAVTRLLQLLVSAVAMAALISTLLIYQLMQRTQLATLRALGLRGRELALLLMLQALALGAAAGLLALPLGYALAWLLVHDINPRAFGWTLGFHPEPAAALQTVLLALLLALLATIYPAWRSLRMNLARELSRE
jgi:putative ABC transport system permease protein